jgi:hypothetical protein
VFGVLWVGPRQSRNGTPKQTDGSTSADVTWAPGQIRLYLCCLPGFLAILQGGFTCPLEYVTSLVAKPLIRAGTGAGSNASVSTSFRKSMQAVLRW